MYYVYTAGQATSYNVIIICTSYTIWAVYNTIHMHIIVIIWLYGMYIIVRRSINNSHDYKSLILII